MKQSVEQLDQLHVADLEKTIREVHLHDLFRQVRLERPQVPVAKDDLIEVTNEQLENAINALAHRLIDRGIQPGDRIGYMGPPSVEFLITYLAIISVGALWLGLNPRYKASELEHILADAQPRIIVKSAGLDSTSIDELHAAAESIDAMSKLITSEELAGLEVAQWPSIGDSEPNARRVSLDPEGNVAVIYTSGTTGKPKGALVRSGAMARLALVQATKWGIDDPRIICNLPINHTGCLGDLVATTLYGNGFIRFLSDFDISHTLEVIKEDKINGLFQIPTQLIMISEHPEFESVAREHLERVAWGGARLPKPFVKLFRSYGLNLQTVYGSSETVASLTASPENATDEQLASTVGQPDPAFQMRLLDDDGQMTYFEDAEPGTVGEVCVKHWTFLPEYLNNPQATSDAYTADGWHRTGDIGKTRSDGLLELIGRTSEMFKSGGYNVYPREIEEVIETVPGVRATAVVETPHPEFSEVGTAFVQLELDAESDAVLTEVSDRLRENLANYKIPKSFYVLDKLPLLPNGKTDKMSLKKQAADRAEF